MDRNLRILRKILLYTVSLVLLLLIAGYAYLYVLPKGLEITKIIPLNTGKDSFVMYAHKESKRKSIRV